MSLMDLKCQESIYITEECCYDDKDNKRLLLGKEYCRRYTIHLFFELPSCAYTSSLNKARLILFKLPKDRQNNIRFNKQCTSYKVGPLLDFFSIYNCDYSPLCIDCNQVVSFKDDHYCSYTEIDITHIVKTWIEGKVENKGLLLYGNRNAPLIIYASSEYGIESMRPRLRLVFDESDFCKPLSSVPCVVTVK